MRDDDLLDSHLRRAVESGLTPDQIAKFFTHLAFYAVWPKATTEDQVHWVAWNITGTSTGLPEGDSADRRARMDAIRSARPALCIAGLAPRRPFHHYLSGFYALDTMIQVQPTSAVETRIDLSNLS